MKGSSGVVVFTKWGIKEGWSYFEMYVGKRRTESEPLLQEEQRGQKADLEPLLVRRPLFFFLLNISLSIVWYTFSSRRLSNPVHRHFVFFLLCYIVLPKCKWQLESKRSQRFTMCSWQEVKVQSWVADHLQGAGFKFKVLVKLIN